MLETALIGLGAHHRASGWSAIIVTAAAPARAGRRSGRRAAPGRTQRAARCHGQLAAELAYAIAADREHAARRRDAESRQVDEDHDQAHHRTSAAAACAAGRHQLGAEEHHRPRLDRDVAAKGVRQQAAPRRLRPGPHGSDRRRRAAARAPTNSSSRCRTIRVRTAASTCRTTAISSSMPNSRWKRRPRWKTPRPTTSALQATRQLRQNLGKHIDDISGKYLIKGETQDVAFMFIPSESMFAELYDALRRRPAEGLPRPASSSCRRRC